MCFPESKAGLDLWYSKLCIKVAKQVAKQLKAWVFGKLSNKKKILKVHTLVFSLPCINQFLALAVKTYAKADPILVIFLFFASYFVQDCRFFRQTLQLSFFSFLQMFSGHAAISSL